MKKNVLLLLLVFSGISFSAQAQLLKKLKDKAQKALEPKTNTNTETKPAAESETESPEGNESKAKTKVKWQPTPDCIKVFTLGEGESFLYDETKVFSNNGKVSTAFIITNKKYEYYLIEDGNRSGPFKEAPLNKINIVSDKRDNNDDGNNNESENISIGDDNRDPVAQQYSKTISNKLYIVFNGKNYGPYDYVAKMVISPDKKRFWAAVVMGGQAAMMAKMGMGNVFLVNEGTVKKQAGGDNCMPLKMMVSQNFSAAGIAVMDNLNQKIITMSSAGKTQEGSMADMYAGNKNSMTIAENGDIISIPSQSPTQLLVNGDEAAVFKVPLKNLNRLFIMKDYKNSVYYQQGKLYRGDGSEEKLTGVAFPKFVTINDKPCIYYYKIHETDAGEKDIYLCSKCL